jgi:hypothetical protein
VVVVVVDVVAVAVVVVVVAVAVVVVVLVVNVDVVAVVAVVVVMSSPQTPTSAEIASEHDAFAATTNSAPAHGAIVPHTHALRTWCVLRGARGGANLL